MVEDDSDGEVAGLDASVTRFDACTDFAALDDLDALTDFDAIIGPDQSITDS